MSQPNFPKEPRDLRTQKIVSLIGVSILLLVYWTFAVQLEQLERPTGLFAGQEGNPIIRVLASLIELLALYLNPRVLRHLIPPIIGWFFARWAVLGVVESFYGLPDSSEASALFGRLSSTFYGVERPTVVKLETFEEDKKVKPLLKIGGPGRIAVFRNAALVTELNGRFHRVLGPGKHQLARFEYPRTLVDLRPQERDSDEVKMMTSDGIQISTSLTVTFQVLRGDQQPTKDNPFPYDEEAVRTAAYTETVQPDGSVGTWDSLVMLITSGQLRAIVAEYRLDELIVSEANGIDIHRRLQIEMERRAKNIMRGYGVMIRGTRLGRIELREEVEAQRKKYWQAHWNTQRTLQRADGEAEVLHNQEMARAEAEAIMLRAIAEGLQRARRAGRDISSREVVALRLIESLEAMAKNSEQLLALPDRISLQLENLRQQMLLTSGAPEPEESASPD